MKEMWTVIICFVATIMFFFLILGIWTVRNRPVIRKKYGYLNGKEYYNRVEKIIMFISFLLGLAVAFGVNMFMN